MKRRVALRNLAVISAGLTFFPACVNRLKLSLNDQGALQFSSDQSSWLMSMSEAICPKGARSFTNFEPFPDFVAKMVLHSKSEDDVKSFVSGYNACTAEIQKRSERSIENITAEEVVSYFEEILNVSNAPSELSEEEAEIWNTQKSFCQDLRGLSIWHLTTSKEYQEEVLNYQLVPSKYEACIPNLI